jgi:hypothetical protein
MKDLWELHVDECSTNKGKRFMVFAGVLIRRPQSRVLSASIDKWKCDLPDPPSEFSWSAVSVSRRRTYEKFVTGIVHHCKGRELFFRSAIFDKTLIDYRKWQDGDSTLGYYKFLYKFMLCAFIPVIPRGATLHVYLDDRATGYPLGELRWRLNSGVNFRYGGRFSVCAVEPIASEKSHFVQAADVLGGAIAHYKNCGIDNATSKRGKAKDALCRHVLAKSGTCWDIDTPSRDAPFRLWHFQLAKEKTP